MKYLLDTCVLSDFVKGEQNTIQHIIQKSPSELAISSITLMELEYGILLISGKKSAAIKAVIADLIRMIEVIPLSAEIAVKAAAIRAYLHKLRTPIGYYDILIAATAAQHELIMVTANTKEFKRISVIELENWRV